MIKKIIALADVHIKNDQRSEEIQDIYGRMFEQMKEIIDSEGKDNVVIAIAGDVYENHIKVNNEGNIKAGWFWREISKLAPVFVIGGNHDCDPSNLEKVDNITSYMFVAKPENITYLDMELEYASGCYPYDNIVWCVYSQFSAFEKPDIKAAKAQYPDAKFIGLIHGDVKGAKCDNGHVADIGIEKNIFSGLDFVIAGHIHKFQELTYKGTKIVYCSSIIQQGYDENLSGHGFVEWNLEDNSYIFHEVENPDYNFYYFHINDAKDIEEGKEELTNR